MKKTIVMSLVALAASTLGAAAFAGDEPASGLGVGAPTPSIPVIDVTGAYKGELICYVCEFQDDPNVLAFFKGTGPATAQLIVQLNDLYVRHKASNFKAVAMIVAGAEAKEWLEQLSQSHQLEIPLAVFRKGPQDVAARLYELDPAVDNTFLVTVERTVAENVAGIGPSEFGRVATATSAMLANNAGARGAP